MLKFLLKSFPNFLVAVSLTTGLLFAQASNAQTTKAGPITAEYPAKQISPSTYVIEGPLESPTPQNQGFMNNPAFIIGDAGIIVIDAGATVQVGELLLKTIKGISDLPVVATFSTHIHGDHWLGNQAIVDAYPDALHYAHPNMIEQAEGGEGDAWVETMEIMTEGASAGTIYVSPNTEINNNDVITIEGKTFSIYHDEVAHTDTDIAIRFDDERVLFFGDTVINRQLRRLDDGNFKGLIAFLDRMLAVEADVYVPGHGKTGSIQIAKDFKQVIETIFFTVKEEYENGLADFEIKPIVEEKIGGAERWTDIDEALGKIISLAYLEVEEDAF